MKLTTTFIAMALATAAGACGGTAPHLAHTIPDKAVAGISGDDATKIEVARGEVTRAKDAFDAGEFEVRTQAKDVGAIDAKTEGAADAVDAAADAIEAADDKQESELKQAQAKRDQQIAEAKKRYADESQSIRDRYAKLQTANRATLTSAKRSQEVVAAQKEVEAAELAEAKQRKAVTEQAMWVAKAQLEVVKLSALQTAAGVQGDKERADKAAFDAQLAAEQKKLEAAQAKLDARVKATETAKGKLTQAQTRANGQ